MNSPEKLFDELRSMLACDKECTKQIMELQRQGQDVQKRQHKVRQRISRLRHAVRLVVEEGMDPVQAALVADQIDLGALLNGEVDMLCGGTLTNVAKQNQAQQMANHYNQQIQNQGLI